MYLFRALLVWLLIILAESIHGTLRQIFIAPLVGDLTARRIAFFSGIILIFLITWICIRWIAAPSIRSLFNIGLMWAILTVLFEFGLGFFVLDYSWERMFEDYDLSRGGLMGFGLLFMVFAPFLADRIQKKIRL